MDFRTDRQRVEGLGSAHEGVGHWWSQRITSIALVPLTLLFIFPFARHLGQDYAAVRAAYANPFNAIVALLLIVTVFLHLWQGLQVVIEDYVQGKPARTALLLANTLFCWAMGLVGVFAVARIVFAG
ncbi:succinate dehydrogenase, hydrophobic membrane anchor protein [Amaricoccus solimangrovi]|uniref:Succinate dehydrogenase hydrophobic membrane anchor subunit n=1 Tax=Amaricoccus solimangrovi TaxID=2589815 RepID=A0A501WR33_9RHOB|nr:succinate dehydrogenase, hydrophobic membrane anchor protein [Amaricoccus solimangrovi]TPE49727.1 succinate dehydrogenase, hydrophobic membrane anchor protein [Amaricoccus solimangrovi]